jgi:signal transduction histidine kinase
LTIASPAAEDGQRERIQAELIRLWLRSQGSLFTTSAFNVVVAWALRNALDRRVLVIWASTTVGWSAFRYAVWLIFRRRPRSNAETLRWGGLFLAMLTVSGLQTAYLASQAFVPADLEHQIFIVTWVAGLTAGCAATYGGYPPAVAAFIGFPLLTFAGAIFARGTTDSALLGIIILTYLGLLMISARTLNRWIVDILNLRMRNERLTRELVDAKDQAESASEAKSAFMANMSHELRTPLNAVIGFAEMLEKEVLGPIGDRRYVAYAHDVHMSGKHLLSIINTILDLAKAEASHMELDFAPVDAGELLQECFNVMRLQADRASLEFKIAVPAAPLFCQVDETRLKQVVFNLLSNAIKFTDPGGRVSLSATAGGVGEVEIRVADTGIGMTPDEIELALQPFMQVKSPQRRSTAGTGLGLPFAKSIVELHGGRLEIASGKGEGTTVTAVLPGA